MLNDAGIIADGQQIQVVSSIKDEEQSQPKSNEIQKLYEKMQELVSI